MQLRKLKKDLYVPDTFEPMYDAAARLDTNNVMVIGIARNRTRAFSNYDTAQSSRVLGKSAAPRLVIECVA
jgi:hypothetical protein